MLVADGGNKVRAPLLPVIGSEKVIRFLVAAAGRSEEGQRADVVELNGSPAIVVAIEREPVAAISLDIGEGLIRVIHLVGDPDKLRRLVSL